MYNVIALCGESGTGKDRILQEICNSDQENFEPKFHKIINYTTRPKRQGEIDGIHYNFVNNDEFAAQVISGDMIEATEYRDWFYGTNIKSLSETKVNIGVFNPTAINILYDDPRINLYIYKIAASPKTRLLRQLNRQQDPDVNEIIRRYIADQKDFEELEISYTQLNNETEDDLYNIVNYINSKSFGQI